MTAIAPTPHADPSPPAAPRRHPWRPLLVRMHFYAGVFVAPFVILVSLTGLAYALTPQLERLVYPDQLVTAAQGRDPVPLDRQVEAAVRAMPHLALSGVRPAEAPDETTEVNFADPSLSGMQARTVYVDPYTAQVRGSLVTQHGTTPLTTWLGQFHAHLNLGTVGRVYAELASAWALVLVIGGLLLWWERSRRHLGVRTARFWRRLLWVDRSHPGLHRTMSWHATVGAWVLLVTVVLSVTGLMISLTTSSRWTAVSQQFGWTAPRLDPTVAAAPAGAPGGSAGAVPGSAAGPADAHAGHGSAPMGARVPGAMPAGVGVQQVLDSARAAGVSEAVSLTAPSRPGTGWSVAETDLTWPVNLDAAVIDPATGKVVRTLEWSQWPVGAQVYRLSLFFHFGRTFGLLNQVILVVSMIGVIASAVWGYQMWWQRRPRGSGWTWGRAPRRGAWRAAPRGRLVVGVAATVLLAWLMPAFGVSLLAFLAIDAALGWRHRHVRPEPEPELSGGTAS